MCQTPPNFWVLVPGEENVQVLKHFWGLSWTFPSLSFPIFGAFCVWAAGSRRRRVAVRLSRVPKAFSSEFLLPFNDLKNPSFGSESPFFFRCVLEAGADFRFPFHDGIFGAGSRSVPFSLPFPGPTLTPNPCFFLCLWFQSYAQPGLQYIQGQQIYTAHPQGVIVQPPTAVTTIVAAGQPQPIQQVTARGGTGGFLPMGSGIR